MRSTLLSTILFIMNNSQLSKYLLLLILLFSTLPAFHSAEAASLKVLKTRKNQAIVVLPPGMEAKEGDMIEIGGDNSEVSFDRLGETGMSSNSRDNYLSLSAAMPLALSGDTSFAFSASAGYGWNTGGFEINPELTLGYLEEFLFGIGFTADVNFVNNQPGKSFVPGFTFGGSFARAVGVNALGFNGGFVGKIYPFDSSPTAIRLSVTYDGAIADGSFGSTINILDVGLQVYF